MESKRRKSLSGGMVIPEQKYENLATTLKNKLPPLLRPTRGANSSGKNLLMDVLGGQTKYTEIKNFIEDRKQFTLEDYMTLKNMMEEIPTSERRNVFIGARSYKPFMDRLNGVIRKFEDTQELKELRESKKEVEKEKKDVEEIKTSLLSELDKFKTKEIDLYYKDLEKRYYEYSLRELLETTESERKEFPIINRLIKDIQKRAISEMNKIKALEDLEMTQPREIDFNVYKEVNPSRYFDKELYRNDRGFSYITEPSYLEKKIGDEIYREELRAPKPPQIKRNQPNRQTLTKLEMDKERRIKNYKDSGAQPSGRFKPQPTVLNQGFNPSYEPHNPFQSKTQLNDDEIYYLIQ